MADDSPDSVGTFWGCLASWSLLFSGLAIWAATMLVPAHLDVLKLERKHELMRQQTDHMTAQRERYDEFRLALERGEPAAVALLADKHLNLRPVDRVALRMETRPGPIDPPDFEMRPEIALVFHSTAEQPSAGGPATLMQIHQEARSPASASIDAWLYEPLPPQRYQPDIVAEADTALARFTSGSTRLVLALSAGLLIVAGLAIR